MSESKAVAQAEVRKNLGELVPQAADVDIDPAETQEWLSSLDYVLKEQGPGPRPLFDRAITRPRRRRRDSVFRRRQYALRQHDSGRRATRVSRQPRIGATHQIDCSLECDGDGGAQPTSCLAVLAGISAHLPRVRHCTRSGTTISSAAAVTMVTPVMRFSSKVTRRPACTVARFWKAG